MDEPEEYIDFMAKYRDWIAIRRLGIRAETKPEEIVHYLAGLRTTIESKSYPFLGINTSILDQHASRLCEGMRKSYGSLSTALSKMDSTETKKALAESCSKDLSRIAETYLLSKVVTNLGYDTGINQTIMSKIFPDLKPPKAPRRLGKGKKSE